MMLFMLAVGVCIGYSCFMLGVSVDVLGNVLGLFLFGNMPLVTHEKACSCCSPFELKHFGDVFLVL